VLCCLSASPQVLAEYSDGDIGSISGDEEMRGPATLEDFRFLLDAEHERVRSNPVLQRTGAVAAESLRNRAVRPAKPKAAAADAELAALADDAGDVRGHTEGDGERRVTVGCRSRASTRRSLSSGARTSTSSPSRVRFSISLCMCCLTTCCPGHVSTMFQPAIIRDDAPIRLSKKHAVSLSLSLSFCL
jgi:hypothetical protein